MFSAPMVRALLDGRKGMTRRILKPQPRPGQRATMYPTAKIDWQLVGKYGVVISNERLPFSVAQRLWVRETWGHDAPDLDACRRGIESGGTSYGPYYVADAGWFDNHTVRRRPSIHMPRWASRLTLSVTSVKIERLQDISTEDARREGCGWADVGQDNDLLIGDPRPVFSRLWETINGSGAWEANPWVVAIGFQTIKLNIDSARTYP